MSKRPMNFAYGAYPIYVERAQGAHVWDVDGNEYIDYVMGLGPITLGYNYPRVTQAIKEQLEKGIVYGLLSPLEVEAARELTEAVPCAEMVRFLKGGAEVTSAATRIARAYTKREKVLSHGYHGWHDQWTAQKNDGGVPKCLEGTIISFGYNDLPGLEKLFAQHPSQIAAVVMTPAQGVVPKDGYLQGVNEIAHKNGALVVYDEIVTGFRLARGGAQEYFGVKPDLACFAKGMANGMPVAAVVGRRDVMEIADKLLISVTYGGEALSLAALVACLKEYREKDVFGYIWKQGRRIEAGFNESAKRHGFPPVASGLAPMGMFTLKAEPPSLKASAARRSLGEGGSGADLETMWFYLLQECAARGVLMRRGGCTFITYSHTDADVEKTIQVVDEALGELRRHLKQGDLAAQLRRRSAETVKDIRAR
jgi:glutamate-1-semialdehyde aminotransferase